MITESCLLCIFDAVLVLFVGYKIPCLLFCSINVHIRLEGVNEVLQSEELTFRVRINRNVLGKKRGEEYSEIKFRVPDTLTFVC